MHWVRELSRFSEEAGVSIMVKSTDEGFNFLATTASFFIPFLLPDKQLSLFKSLDLSQSTQGRIQGGGGGTFAPVKDSGRGVTPS